MALIGLVGILALLSLISIVVGPEDPRHRVDPRSDTHLWMLGIR
jgi:hypothetical protein